MRIIIIIIIIIVIIIIIIIIIIVFIIMKSFQLVVPGACSEYEHLGNKAFDDQLN